MSSWTPTTYKTRNWAEYNLSLKNRGSLSIWFDPGMTWEAAPSGRRGRQQAYSDGAIQACLTLKVLFGLPLRQTTGFVESLLRLVGLDWSVPDFSTLCRRQRTLSVAIPYKGSAGPLHLLIPSRDIAAQYPAGQWIAQASKLRAKGNGMPVSMLGQNAACGARSTFTARQAHL